MSSSPDRLVVPGHLDGQRLDQVLDELVDGESRSRLQKMVRRGRVLLDGRRVLRSNVRVPGGCVIRLLDDSETGPRVRVVHEDADLVVVDKPARLLVHPTERLQASCLTDWLVARYGELPTVAGRNRPGIVHRLDRDTSGCLVVARTREAHKALRTAFRERKVEKRYLALCHGGPRSERFVIEHPLGPASSDPTEDRQRAFPPDGGKESSTEFRVRERFEGFTWMECRPRTGRRHQIRVHLSSEGLPIVGDDLYARPSVMRWPEEAPPVPRQALHAVGLAFEHPRTGEWVRFEASPPADLQQAITWLRAERATSAPVDAEGPAADGTEGPGNPGADGPGQAAEPATRG